jgi:nucleotide-binding universal stress UspA family protein
MALPSFVPSEAFQVRRVLISTDFSQASRNALLYAIAIARHYGARLYIVNVVSSIGYRLAGPGAEVLAAEQAVRDLKELWSKFSGSNQDSRLDLTLIVREGEVSAQLEGLIQQEHVDLAVVGTHGRAGFPKMAMGSVAEDVFRKVSCPVLTVGPHSASDWPERELGAEKAILFATDFGDPSLRALPYAVSVANHSGSKLILLHVAKFATENEPALISGDTRGVDEQAQRDASLRRLQELKPNGLRIEPELRVTFGLPVDGILAEAARTGAGLIVLGLQHKSLPKLLEHLRSTTTYGVVTGAHCPVLTVRT